MIANSPDTFYLFTKKHNNAWDDKAHSLIGKMRFETIHSNDTGSILSKTSILTSTKVYCKGSRL